MLDVIAPHDHELPLPIEIESVDDAETGLPAPAGPRLTEAAPEQEPVDHYDYDSDGDDEGEKNAHGQQFVVRKQVAQRLHRARLSICNGTDAECNTAKPPQFNTVNYWLTKLERHRLCGRGFRRV